MKKVLHTMVLIGSFTIGASSALADSCTISCFEIGSNWMLTGTTSCPDGVILGPGFVVYCTAHCYCNMGEPAGSCDCHYYGK